MTLDALALTLRWHLEAKLGRCVRCMSLTAVACGIAWLGVVVVQTQRPLIGLLIAAYAAASAISLLAAAHVAAFVVLHSVPEDMRGPHAPAQTPGAATRRGCGCGSTPALVRSADGT